MAGIDKGKNRLSTIGADGSVRANRYRAIFSKPDTSVSDGFIPDSELPSATANKSYLPHRLAAPLHPDDMSRIEDLSSFYEAAAAASEQRSVRAFIADSTAMSERIELLAEAWAWPNGSFSLGRFLNVVGRSRQSKQVNAQMDERRISARAQRTAEHDERMTILARHRDADDLNGYQWSLLRKGSYENVEKMSARHAD